MLNIFLSGANFASMCFMINSDKPEIAFINLLVFISCGYFGIKKCKDL